MKNITILNSLTSARAALDKSQGYVVTLLLLIAMALPATAQNGTYVGTLSPHGSVFETATPNNQRNKNYSPFLTKYPNYKVQYLFTRDEFAELGMPYGQGPKTLRSIAFNITSVGVAVGGSYDLTDVRIKIGNTTLTNLAPTATASFGEDFGSGIYTGEVQVDIPVLTLNATGWKTIELGPTGFVWNGNDNIIIEISRSSTAAYEYNPTNLNFAVESYKCGVSGTDNKYVRGARTINNTYTFGTKGHEMKQGGANHNIGSATNSVLLTYGDEMAHRPAIRFQADCGSVVLAGTASAGGEATKKSELGLGGCRQLVLEVLNSKRPYGATYIWESSNTADFFIKEVVGTAETLAVSQSTIAKYYRRITTCDGLGDISVPYFLSAAPINNFNGTTWTAGAPDANSDRQLTITGGTPTLAANAKACGCTVSAGTFTIGNGATLHVDGALKVAPSADLIVDNGGSLVQIDPTAANTGQITVRRNSQPMVAYDFTYWSSPVQGQPLGSFSPHTMFDKMYKWNPTTQAWVIEPLTNTFTPGVGYIIRAPQATYPGATYTGSINGPYTGTYIHNGIFKGAANNGNITAPITLGTNKTNMIANPYPSPLDLNEFYDANSDKIDGTFMFWSHNTPITGQQYTPADFAYYNRTGGLATSPNGILPTKNLAIGQSVVVKAKTGTAVAPSTVIYKNSMRRDANVPAPFFRTNSNVSVDANASSENRYWLNLTTATAFKQVLVGYMNGATNNYDNAYDGDAVAGASISFYSIADGHQLAIQGRAAFNVNDQVPLGFVTNATGTHRIELANSEGVFGSQQIFLEDKLTNVTHNLKEGGYDFSSAAGTFNDRFVLKYVGLTSNLGVVNNNITESAADFIAFKQATDLVISAGATDIDFVKVYDLSGRMLLQQKANNANDVVISNPNWASQVLIVQMHTADKIVLTKKVVF